MRGEKVRNWPCGLPISGVPSKTPFLAGEMDRPVSAVEPSCVRSGVVELGGLGPFAREIWSTKPVVVGGSWRLIRLNGREKLLGDEAGAL